MAQCGGYCEHFVIVVIYFCCCLLQVCHWVSVITFIQHRDGAVRWLLWRFCYCCLLFFIYVVVYYRSVIECQSSPSSSSEMAGCGGYCERFMGMISRTKFVDMTRVTETRLARCLGTLDLTALGNIRSFVRSFIHKIVIETSYKGNVSLNIVICVHCKFLKQAGQKMQ